MKKILCVIISALTLLTLFAACSNCQFDKPTSSEKDDIFSDKDDNKVLEDASALSFYKEFVGGTGYKVESSTVSHYEYEGGEMSIDFAIINQAAGFECGLFVILNGVFQQFTFKGSDGKATAEGYMQIIDIPAKERVTFTLNFTPNTGKKGDILNIAVGTLTEPSYTSVYTGWPRYAKYGQHGFAGVSGMTLIMNSDGTGTAPSETAAISKAEITDEYYDLLTGAKENDKKAEAWRSNYAFALYYDKYDENRDLIAVPETESVNLKLDVLGKEADYRISVFVNNEIVRFENDRTYFEVHNTTEKVTHIEFPVNIFSMAKNSHIYTVVSEKDNDNSSATYGTFVPIYKTSTYYFIKGEVSEVTSESKTDVAEENTSQQNGTIGIGKNEIAALSGMELLYVDSVDGNTICCVVRDENMNKKALFLNKDNSAVIGEADLEENAMYYTAAGEKLVVVESQKTEDGAYIVIDKRGKIIDKKPYVINAAAEKERNSGLSLLAGALKKVSIDTNSGDFVYLAFDEAYLVSSTTGEKTRLDFLSKEHIPTQIRNFSNGKILTVQTDDNGSTFTLSDINGKKIKEIAYSESKDLTCVGNHGVIFPRKNLTGISSDNKITLLNCITGETKELNVETNTENQWCALSSDAKYVLTMDNDSFFRLYDTQSRELIGKFSVDGTDFGLFEIQTFIDSGNKAIYIQTNKEGVYGVYVKKF